MRVAGVLLKRGSLETCEHANPIAYRLGDFDVRVNGGVGSREKLLSAICHLLQSLHESGRKRSVLPSRRVVRTVALHVPGNRMLERSPIQSVRPQAEVMRKALPVLKDRPVRPERRELQRSHLVTARE